MSTVFEPTALGRLKEIGTLPPDDPKWLRTFSNANRLVGKEPVKAGKASQLNLTEKKIPFAGWTADRLARVYMLLHLSPNPENVYRKQIEKLFEGAAVSEQIALYSALPFLSYPDSWHHRCAEGIRSNIGDVLEAIMYDNPYPAAYLEEPAWNQMILKAIFTGKDLKRIIGLHERKNAELSRAILDYTAERWAAGRNIDLYIWSLVESIAEEDGKAILLKGTEDKNFAMQQAAALTLQAAIPLSAALVSNELLAAAISSNELNWDTYNTKNFSQE